MDDSAGVQGRGWEQGSAGLLTGLGVSWSHRRVSLASTERTGLEGITYCGEGGKPSSGSCPTGSGRAARLHMGKVPHGKPLGVGGCEGGERCCLGCPEVEDSVLNPRELYGLSPQFHHYELQLLKETFTHR